MPKKRKPRPGDLLCNTKFVRLASYSDLPIAMEIQDKLRQYGIGVVIINDEKVQTRSAQEKENAEAPPEGFRVEVPEERATRARRILRALEDPEQDQ